jgi:DNA-binding IclR family transcriptional regulator
MPGLCLHLTEAARLFGVRTATCHVILDDLVSQRLLRRASDGRYLAV